MVFDSFNLGTQIESNNSINYTSYLDQVNHNLYIIQSSNINIYNIIGCNLANKDSNIYISCNINLYNDIEHFYIDTSNYLNIYSIDLSCNFEINKLNLENRAYSINNTDNCNFISGYYYDGNKYLITESGKDVYRINSDNIRYHILLTDNPIIKNKNNNVVSILLENILYVTIADFNIIIKCDIANSSDKTEFIIENYSDIVHKFSKAVYSRLKQKIYLIPYNLKYLCSIDTVSTVNIEKGERLTFRNKPYLVNTNIREIFSTAIENQGYIYMIPKKLNLIFIYSLYTDSLHNIIDISAFNTTFLENNKFVNAHLYEDINHKKIFMIPNNSTNIGVIDYDLMDNSILESDFSFDIITKNIFNSDYEIEDQFIELGSKIQYSSSYKNGFVNFRLKTVDPNTADIFEFRPKTNIYMNIKNKLVAFYNFYGNTEDSENDYHLTASGNVQYIERGLLDSNLHLLSSATLKLINNKTKFENNFTNVIGIGFESSNLVNEAGTIFKYKSIECSYINKTNLTIKFKNIESNIQSDGFDHIFLNANQNSLDIYLNGMIECNISSSGNTTNNDLEIGFYNGYLDNLSIFKEQLTENEIWYLYNNKEFHSDIFKERYNNITSTFTDNNGKPIFKFYKPVNERKYQEININELLITNKIQNISVNNIYSIENDTVYFIPYNYDYLLALDLKENVIRLINIKRTEYTNDRNLISNYIDDVSKGKFKASIIVGDNLYIAPYIESYKDSSTNSSAIILIYNFVNDNKDNFVNIEAVDISQILNINAGNQELKELFSTILFYNKNLNDYLFFINENTFPLVVYNITDEEAKKVYKDDDYHYIDGYIKGNYMYLLDYYGSNLYIYDIVINRTNISLTSNNHIDLNEASLTYDTPLFSKILEHNNAYYFIPYNTNYIAIYSNTSVTNEYLSDYTSNQKLYKGGTIMELNNNAYLIMVPYYADKLYMYNITENNLTYIKDVIFETNRFTGCTVDLKGNLYMNTAYGDVLYYSLSIAKFYKQPRLPVLIKNNREISFKDLYEKFHTDYIYPNYNYNNKQIKLSDYYNNGGAEYYTVSAINDNKFIFDEDHINIAKNVYENISYSYDDFITRQTEACNILELSKFKTVVSQRYEYYDYYIEKVSYTITSITIDSINRYVYYIKELNNGRVELHLKATKDSDQDNLFYILRKNPDILAEYTIDISQYLIKTYVETNTEGFSTYTKIVINLKEGTTFNGTILLDSSNFIENNISDTKPNQTMINVSTIEMNISGEVKEGIKITLDDFNGNYLASLNSIIININDNGIIKYYKDTLIELINPKTLLIDNININIKETIRKQKLYCKTIDNYLLKITENNNRKISKLIIELTESTIIDLNNFIDLIYLREIVIIKKSFKPFNNRNDIRIINGNDLKQDINIIIYENFDNLISVFI
jgi:hypothetical protein